MWAWSVSLNLDNWPALRARFNSERAKVISGSNYGFKARSTVQQPNPSKFKHCKSTFLKLCQKFLFHWIFFFFFFNVHFSRRVTRLRGWREFRTEWRATAGTGTKRQCARAKTLYERKCAASCRADSTSSFFTTLPSEPASGRRGESDYARGLERWTCKTQEGKMEGWGVGHNFHLPKSLQRQEHHKQTWGWKCPSYGISHFTRLDFFFLLAFVVRRHARASAE